MSNNLKRGITMNEEKVKLLLLDVNLARREAKNGIEKIERGIRDIADELYGPHDVPSGPTPPPQEPVTALLLVGHNEYYDSGAEATNGIAEWPFNNGVAVRAQSRLATIDPSISLPIIRRPSVSSYNEQIRAAAGEAKTYGAKIIVLMHFNDSDNKRASGAEVYCSEWENNPLAKMLVSMICAEFDLPNRGVRKPNRGSSMIESMEDVGIEHVFLLESFFGSNESDVEKVMVDDGERLAGVLAKWVAWAARQ